MQSHARALSSKKEPITVLVRDQFPGDWTVVESSVPARKLAATLTRASACPLRSPNFWKSAGFPRLFFGIRMSSSS